MKLTNIAAALVLAAAPFAANASLTTLTTSWPPVPSSGLESVLFNKVNATVGGGFVAMGAHAYKNSAYLANNGTDTFYASSGIFAETGRQYANWSFDFAYDLGNCTTCTVNLEIDTNPTSVVEYANAISLKPYYGAKGAESWNMEMGFLNSPTFNFDPYSASSTAFRLTMVDSGSVVASSTVTVDVPEPGTLALAAAALAGLGFLRRRKA